VRCTRKGLKTWFALNEVIFMAWGLIYSQKGLRCLINTFSEIRGPSFGRRGRVAPESGDTGSGDTLRNLSSAFLSARAHISSRHLHTFFSSCELRSFLEIQFSLYLLPQFTCCLPGPYRTAVTGVRNPTTNQTSSQV
jgi:hypothetical protein